MLRILAVGLLLVASARADETSEAKSHFEAGQRLFTEGDYSAAVAEFLRAYELKPHPDVLINIATSYERIYRPSEARDHYERFLHDAATTPEEAPLRQLAENRLRVLRALPGAITVDANRPGATTHLEGMERSLDGTTPHRFAELSPGHYHIHISLADHVPQDLEVELLPGGQNVVNVQLEHQLQTLTIFSRPDGARVFLDDREVGTTPFSQPIEVGRKRRLRLEAADYPAHRETIDLLPEAPLRRNIVFRRPLRSGRSELVLGSMVYGGAGAVLAAEAAGGPKLDGLVRLGIDLGASLVGVGMGFLVSTLVSDDEMKVGHSSTIIGATAWGTALGASLSFGLRVSEQNELALALLGGSLGLGAGILTARLADPSPGDAAIVNSGGLWGTLTGLLISQAIPFGVDQRPSVRGWMMLGGCSLGLLSGGLLTRWFEVSRGHVAVVDVSGLAGLALAFAVGYGVPPDDATRLENGARYGLGGMAVGLIAGGLLARKYKDDLPPGQALITHENGRWALGIPQLQLVPIGATSRVTATLASGTF